MSVEYVCPNCRFMIDDGMETLEAASEDGKECEHRDILTNEYFGVADGENFKFRIYKGYEEQSTDDRTSPYLDGMLEDVNRALMKDGIDPKTGFWYDIDSRDPYENSIWATPEIDKALGKMFGSGDDEDEGEVVSRASRKNKRNRQGGFVQRLKDATHKVTKPHNDMYARAPKYTEEERAQIIAEERAGLIGS